ncbi:hypothetical protein ABBQ38_014160 [Trebouxia sp. C0009 RCD-2024]
MPHITFRCGCGAPVCQPSVSPASRVRYLPTLKRCRPSTEVSRRRHVTKKVRRDSSVSTPAVVSAATLNTDEQVIQEQIDKAASILNSMMEDIHQEAFVSGAVSELTGDEPEVSEAAAIKNAVASRMEQLDEAFLVALAAYIGAAEEQGDSALAGRLSRIQQQVLQEVSQRLPPEMRVLDTVLRLLSRSERMSTLRQSASGQGDTVPSCDIKRIQGAALQLISDMEEKVAIPDRRLLARLCIAREEIAEVVAEHHSPGQSGSAQDMYESNLSLKNQGIPKASLAFLKELLTMSDKAKRVAFLKKAFLEDFEPGKPVAGASAQQSVPEAVRPGGFLSCVTASKAEMASMKGVETTIRKLDVIRQEALRVLESIAA